MQQNSCVLELANQTFSMSRYSILRGLLQDKPGNHACGYCGQRFFNPHATKGEDKNINHYNC